MMTNIDLLDQWLKDLNLDKKVIGVYEQGSRIWGFADKNSDRDFMVVWRDEYPNKEKRQTVAKNLGGVIHQFQDIPTVGKGVDMFEFGNERLNVAHVKSSDFFSYYQKLNNLGKYYEEELLRMGGFVNGVILFDTDKKMESYRHSIALTNEIVESVKVRLKDDLEHDLKILNIAANRESIIRLMHQTSEVLNQMHVWYYMRKRMWLMSDKWFEAFVKKYGWEDNFVILLREIKSGLEAREVATRLLEIAKSWGFEPSKKFRS